MSANRLGRSVLLCFCLALLATLSASAQGPHTYRVRSGDTLPAIASRFGVPLEGLLRAHGLRLEDTLYTGDVVVLPLAPAAEQHTVATGETLQGIAAQYGVAPTQIAWRNGLADPQGLRAGETLVIPEVAGSAPWLDVALVWPVEGQRVSDTLRVSGWGQAFDNALVVQVQDAEGRVVAEGAAAIHAEIGQVGSFATNLRLPEGISLGQPLLITLWRRDMATGDLTTVQSVSVVVR
jgi:LysM repeat protein